MIVLARVYNALILLLMAFGFVYGLPRLAGQGPAFIATLAAAQLKSALAIAAPLILALLALGRGPPGLVAAARAVNAVYLGLYLLVLGFAGLDSLHGPGFFLVAWLLVGAVFGLGYLVNTVVLWRQGRRTGA